jgi:hypothetical protein
MQHMGEINIRYKLNYTSDKNMKVQYKENTPGKYQSENFTQETVGKASKQTNYGLHMNECERSRFST